MEKDGLPRGFDPQPIADRAHRRGCGEGDLQAPPTRRDLHVVVTEHLERDRVAVESYGVNALLRRGCHPEDVVFIREEVGPAFPAFPAVEIGDILEVERKETLGPLRKGRSGAVVNRYSLREAGSLLGGQETRET